MHVNRVLRETGVVLAAGLLYGSAAFAQSSTMIGTIIDAQSRQPVPDVVVTATSPNLQGEQTVVSDAQGNYRIPQLPPGVYTLRFEKEQFRPYARADVQLRLNRTIRVNVELLPESLGEVVEITGTPPTIDVGSTTTGVNVDQEFIKRIAVARPGGKGGAARSFESLAELAPGAQTDQYGVSINGATSPENGYVVDGLSTNDPAYGVNASPLSIEFVQDVNIITGGYMPEFGRSTGGVVNAVTRSGSNEFHGSVFANWTPGTLEGDRKLVREEGTVITGLNELKNLGDFGATLGGPILKDKLWFFAGFAPSFTRYQHTRTLNALEVIEDGPRTRYATDENGFTVANAIPGSERQYFADSRSLQYMGKLTYLINQDHNVSFALNGTPSSTGGLGKLTLDPRTGLLPGALTARPGDFGLTENNANTTSLALKYAGAFMDKKVLVDANVGWFHQTASTLPGDGSKLGDSRGLAGYSRMTYTNPRTLTVFESLPEGYAAACDPVTYLDEEGEEQVIDRCPVTGYSVGGPGFMSDAKLDRYQINAKATYLLNALGTHVLKAGVDTEFLVYDQTKAYGGGVFFQESVPYAGATYQDGTVSDFRRYGYQTAPDTPITQLTQQAKSTSTTVGGFVQDSWSLANRVTLNLGVRYDVQAMYGGDGELALIMGNQWSPRVGAIVDPFANGRAKFFVNFARYYEQVPLNLLDRAFPGERRFSARRQLAEPGDGTGRCDPSSRESQETDCRSAENVIALPESNRNPNRLYTGGKVENEPVDPDIKPQSSDEVVVGGEYELLANTRIGASYTHRDMNSVIEDMSRDDGNTYFLGNPGSGFAKEFPKPERNYDAVTVYLNRTFADGWLAQANYTWSRLYGNYPGLFRPETAQLDPNILSDFDLIELLENRTGLLPFDRTHQIKVFGAKEFNLTSELSASLGVSYRGSSGTPINYYGAHSSYGTDESFVLPRGEGGRTPWVNTIDSNIGVNYRVSKDSVVSFTLDVFNLFNFQGTDAVDQTYTTLPVQPIANGSPSDLPGNVDWQAGEEREDDPDTELIDESKFGTVDGDINKNFKNPTRYQPPRQVRFGIRYTF
ncbi:TonB-dependent receptor [Myxococcus sp. RHSTA-1-4]|uniref:TonB-dependent receptor n=1 Tax=Myxococcus sp. RHSTA-1-4 TaxID=2874601 RepID=UPI001CC03C2F|nr:TonB-dependent receptor [Myxococcus sp. RHSTA-1-4]MBZ4421195.1 TonB-dependent receptor [Myxococcus sp. RHSTA-1-4]